MYTIKRPSSVPAERLEEITIYEYSDLLELRQNLEYGLAMSEILNRRKKPGLLSDFITFDVETTSLQPNTRYNPDEHAVAFCYTYQFYIFGRVWLLREEAHFIHFMETLADWAKSHYITIVCYIHNASFEWQFIRNMIPFDSENVFALKARKVLKYTAFNNSVEFRCSYLLSNMSLEKFAENYVDDLKYRKDKDLIDYELVRFPWDDLSEEILYYSAMDVIALYYSVKSIMEKEHDDIKSIPATNTGYVRRACRSACLGDNTKKYRTPTEKETYYKFKRYRQGFLKMSLDLEQYNLLLRAYRGGNTHGNRFCCGKIFDSASDPVEEIGSYDFASSYPAELICSDEFPMGRLMDCTKSVQNIKDFEYYCKNYWVVAEVVFEDLELRDPYHTYCPYIPSGKCAIQKIGAGIYDNGRIISQPGFTQFAFLGCEWDIIKKQYRGKMKIVKCYYTIRGYLPDALRNQCFDWYNAKTSLKNVSGMEYEYMKSKNRVNSIYGLMVEKIIKNIIEEKDGELVERRPTQEEAQEQLENFYTPMQRKFVCYQWGVTITALARVRHMDLIGIAGADFVYGDTDSVKLKNWKSHEQQFEDYNKKWKAYIAQCGVSYEAYTSSGEYQCLGLADFECTYEKFAHLGAKKYAYEHDGKLGITIAGVPKKAGAKLLQKIENFKPGFTFSVPDTSSNEDRQMWKKKLVYRDDTDYYLEVGDHKVHIGSCIAMSRTTYDLDLTQEYTDLTGFFDRYVEEDVY